MQHLEYSESYASIQFLTMPPFNLEYGLLEKFILIVTIFDSLWVKVNLINNKFELLNLSEGYFRALTQI